MQIRIFSHLVGYGGGFRQISHSICVVLSLIIRKTEQIHIVTKYLWRYFFIFFQITNSFGIIAFIICNFSHNAVNFSIIFIAGIRSQQGIGTFVKFIELFLSIINLNNIIRYDIFIFRRIFNFQKFGQGSCVITQRIFGISVIISCRKIVAAFYFLEFFENSQRQMVVFRFETGITFTKHKIHAFTITKAFIIHIIEIGKCLGVLFFLVFEHTQHYICLIIKRRVRVFK